MRVCEKTATAEEPPNGAITPSRESAYVCVYWGHTAVSVLPSKLHCSPGSTSARCGRCGAPVSLPLSQFLHFYFFFCSTHLSFLTSALMVTAPPIPLTHSHTHTHTHTHILWGWEGNISVSSCPVATHVHVTGWWPPHWVTLHCTCVCVRETQDRKHRNNCRVSSSCAEVCV